MFIAQVSAAVACAWLDEWFAGRTADDTERMDGATAALGTTRQWTMLQEIADQGGWSDELWRYVDGLGNTDDAYAATPSNLDSGLCCTRFD